jgi:hypothetical protein
MKLIVAFVLLACGSTSAKEQKATPQPLVDIQNLRTNLNTKTEAVGRFFKLLTSSSADTTTEKPRDESISRFPFISRSFRRLNIFGLQTPPSDPPRNADGTPCSCVRACVHACDTKELIPDILHVTEKPAFEVVPNFSVVQPQSFVQKSVEISESHYPKLNLNELLQHQAGDLLQQHYYEGVPFSYQQQYNHQK